MTISKNKKGHERPLVTVVTVVYNGLADIEDTIKSVLKQDYARIEYIIIDGSSTDGTVDLISKYSYQIDYFISEPDRGIYDAMNKGISVATGDWIIFMNAGDWFLNPSTISKAISMINPGTIIAAGAVEIRYPNFTRTEVARRPDKLWSGMQFSHQSAFIRLDYHRKNSYDIRHPIAADLAFMYQARKSGVHFQILTEVVASVVTGGVSEKDRVRTIRDSCEAVCQGEFKPLTRVYYGIRVLDAKLRSLFKCALPESVVINLIKLK
ncbi:glycosyltransferase family 2 protein [Lentilitoribacter sp. Alg239-R112]|uniref:glycosyltransferase family 2 protein n=1 Tax=Lentilitoribacter sp. Alg239-R112 TaxID=2305987 RepID=UPI0018D6E09A|nr:glycosyltransferase family 2 protein [Lentilitoribacter sp. Alg239-R112]